MLCSFPLYIICTYFTLTTCPLLTWVSNSLALNVLSRRNVIPLCKLAQTSQNFKPAAQQPMFKMNIGHVVRIIIQLYIDIFSILPFSMGWFL